jgi:hypothetical protein
MGAQGEGYVQTKKVFPTLAQVTSGVFARKAKHGGNSVETSTTNLVAAQISLDALSLPPNTPTQQTKPDFGRGVRTQGLAQLRSAPQQTVPLKVNKKFAGLRRQPSILHPLKEEAEMGTENEEEAAFSRMVNRRTEDRPMSPSSQRQIPPSRSPIHRLGSIRRSASFSGWNRPVEHRDSVVEDGESLIELFDQLSDFRSWIEGFDGTPDRGET